MYLSYFSDEFENIIVLQSQQQRNRWRSKCCNKTAVANFLFNIVIWLPVIEEILNMFPHEHPVEILLRKLHVNLTRCVTVVQKISPKGFEQCGISTNNNNSDQLIAKYFQLYFPILQRAADSMEKQMLGRISTRLVLEKAYIKISHLVDKSTLTYHHYYKYNDTTNNNNTYCNIIGGRFNRME